MSASSFLIVGSIVDGLSVGGGDREYVDRLTAIGEKPLLRGRRHDPARARHLARLAELLVVEEEECLVMAIVEAGDLNGTADTEAWLIDLDQIFRSLAGRGIRGAIAIVEPVVRIELRRVAM